MATHRCKTRCYYRNRMWEVGDPLTARKREDVPHHFISIAKIVEANEKIVPDELDSGDLTLIRGVGSATAGKLLVYGIKSILEVANSKSETITAAIGGNPNSSSDIILSAMELLTNEDAEDGE